MDAMTSEKPRQSWRGLWNISFGFFGIQIAFGLQNANVSRIFQSLGSDVGSLALLWIAGPVTGLLVQPIIGHFSDRTWGRFGRRRPYFLAGAILAALALLGMPNASVLIAAALLLWMLDASINVSMEPFRAFVGDMVAPSQRTAGYAFQTAFIGAGAVVGSLAPFAMAKLGVSNVAAAGGIPDSVRYSFYLGAVAIFGAVLWTVLTTREYPPEQMQAFGDAQAQYHASSFSDASLPKILTTAGVVLIFLGALLTGTIYRWSLERDLYVLGGLFIGGGVLMLAASGMIRARLENALVQIMSDLVRMPGQMWRLALAQFFSWLALFVLWIYTTPVVAQYVFHSTDAAAKAYNDGADWVGVLFSVYNGVAALAAFVLPVLARRIGAPRTHMICLLIGAASFASLLVIRNQQTLLLPMVGIGLTWASILTMPYVILASVLPPQKFGIYMGIFNFFIVLPQLVVATVMGAVIHAWFPTEPIWTMACAAVVMTMAAAAMLLVRSEPNAAA
ncbi:SLC45 family MFS transporter [Sphingomonas panacisoli]|uniref:SLC45 family MFS transporter n=1 Tax=Sphingomonas panacisoli TaxID=1813879 RepID=A0A5B8LFX2_9SPHN|nr:MFS transporter [Sphingomonas panacisoli]QDZ07148.1 SLC45 family MFS transporter [Sphingomonas panacisoli]